MKIVRLYKPAALWVLVFVFAIPFAAVGQESQQGGDPFRPEELDQMLAPIALYPDSLLMQILAASTYPVEVVQADRWVKKNPGLKGDALNAAVEKENWDPSIKAMTQYPDVLAMMSEKLDWTTELGDAFLAQQRDVIDSVQRLRQKAYEAGNLKTTKEQKVVVERETIVIQPAQPQVVYVPTYNPTVVYGTWPYPAYPPYYYYPPGYVAGAAAFSFAAGVAVGAAWGHWGFDWHHHHGYHGHRDVDISYKKEVNIKGGDKSKTWKHNPSHRKGAGYRDRDTAKRYGLDRPGRGQSRKDYRGFEGGRGRTGDRRTDLARTDSRQRRSDLGGRTADRSRRGTDLTGRRPGTREGAGRDFSRSSSGQGRQNAFSGAGSGGRERAASYRGQSSRSSSSFSRGGSSHGSRGGFSRGGGGRRGGGRRR